MPRKTYCLCIMMVFLAAASSLFAVDNTTEPVTPQEGSSEVTFPLGSQRPLPIYIAELANLNDYNIFGSGGWDGNWYAGFNVCWMEKLPPPPPAEYRRAFIGVKLGRMKTRPVQGKPIWEKEAIPGDFYVSLASTPAWRSNQKYFLASTADIPLEGDPENALQGVGEARWFWAEVPVSAVAVDGPNYVALWSPTEYFVSTASSPILAGGWGSQELNTWMNNDVRGYPPLNPANSLKTGITIFEPAIAMKLIPQGTEQTLLVMIAQIKNGRRKTADKVFIAAVSGDAIEKVWLETSIDGKQWQKHGRYLYSAPYMLTLKADDLPAGKVQVRCAASDIWENTGYSTPVEIVVAR